MPQGTVKSFDPQTGAARLLTDDLREIEITPQTFARSGLRELRLGQRIRFELEHDDDEERVTNLNVVSL